MEHKTLVAVFDQHGEAQQALQALFNAGFSDGQTRLTVANAAAADGADDSIASVNAHRPDYEESISERLTDFFGFSDDDNNNFAAVRRGSSVLCVAAASDEECERAEDIINQFHPIEIDQRDVSLNETPSSSTEAP